MIQRNIASLLRHITNPLDTLQPEPKPVFKGYTLIYDDLDIDYTKTSLERLYALYTAISYIVSACMSGAIVECGVWRSASSMLSALRLRALGETTRILYLNKGLGPQQQWNVGLRISSR
jgi:hypothetical protein